MFKSTVTLILNSYNRPGMLDRAIKSVAEQTFKEWELIVADDCSTLDTASIVNKWQNICRDNRIVFLRSSRNWGNVTRGRNDALDICRGEFICLSDDDNILRPNKFEDLYRVISADSSIGMVYGQTRNCDLNGVPGETIMFDHPQSYEYPRDANRLSTFNFIDGGEMMIRKSIIDELGGFDERFDTTEDWDLLLRISQNKRRIVQVDKEVQLYCIHDNNRVALIANTAPYLSSKDEQFMRSKIKYYNRGKLPIMLVLPDPINAMESQRDVHNNWKTALSNIPYIELFTTHTTANLDQNYKDFNPLLIFFLQIHIHNDRRFPKHGELSRVGICIEDPFAEPKNRTLLDSFEWLITNDAGSASRYNSANFKNVMTMPVLLPVDSIHGGNSNGTPKNRDIVLVGYPYENRVKIVEELIPFLKQHKIKLTLVSKEWKQYSGVEVISQTVSPRDMMSFYMSGKLILNINRLQGASSVNRGFIEAYSGTPQLIDNTRSDIVRYFSDILTFSTVEDLKKKIIVYFEQTNQKERDDYGEYMKKVSERYTLDKALRRLIYLLLTHRRVDNVLLKEII